MTTSKLRPAVRYSLFYCVAIFLVILSSVEASLVVSHSVQDLMVSSTNNLLAATNIAAFSKQPLLPTHLKPIDLKVMLTRVVQVRVPRNDECVIEKVKSMARTLGALQPTFVSGLLRVSDELPLPLSQVENFTTVRKEVLASNPRCKFDVVINGSSYATPAAFVTKLQEINEAVMPDIFLIDISNSEPVYPAALAKAIEFAHSHGQCVGYQGPITMIPNGIDFIVLRIENSNLRREEISALRSKHHLPILVSSSFHQLLHDHQEGAREFATNDKAKSIIHLAEEQSSFGFHLIYPIRNPCFQENSPLDASSDNALLVTIKALMARYN